MIGIDLSDTSIKMVRLGGRGERRLQAYCWKPVPAGAVQNGIIQDRQVVRKVVEESLRSCRLYSYMHDSAAASIPEVQSFMRVVELPLMETHEVGEAVQWEVAQHIPFGLENVYLDWQPLPGDGHGTPDRMEVLVGASQKKVVDPVYEILREAGLDVAALELESQAIIRALISPQLHRTQGLLIIDLGGSSVNVVVLDHGAVRFAASLQRGVQAFMEQVFSPSERAPSGPSQAKHLPETSNVIQRLRPFQEELVLEVHGIVEFYNSSSGEQHKIREIILTGGGSNLPGFAEVFLRHFDDVHVQRGNPWVNVFAPSVQARLPLHLQESVHFTTAIGLALRSVLS